MILSLVLPFYIGILTQAFLLIRSKFSRVELFIMSLLVGISLIGLLPGRNEDTYDLYTHLFVVACIFSFTFASVFRTKILSVVSKEVVGVWNLIFLYIVFQNISLYQNPVLSGIVMLPSLIILLNVFFSFGHRHFWKVFFYVWLLIMIVVIASFYFSFGALDFFFSGGSGETISSLEMFFLGAAFLYLSSNFAHIISIIPLPGRHQTFKSRILEVKRNMFDLASKYEHSRSNDWKLTFFVVVFLALVLNFSYNFISDSLIIPLLITLNPLFLRKKESETPAL